MYFRYSTIILPTHDGFRHLSVMTPCERHADACPNGGCVNLGDDYVCDCGDGFETSMDGKSCIRKWHNGKTWGIYSVNQYLLHGRCASGQLLQRALRRSLFGPVPTTLLTEELLLSAVRQRLDRIS